MLNTLVIYDITQDEIRNAVAEVCKNFGLARIQKSAFLGKLPSARRKELRAALERTLKNAEGNIQIFPICNACLALREILGKPIKLEQEQEAVLVV